jgi:hypothetical protein
MLGSQNSFNFAAAFVVFAVLCFFLRRGRTNFLFVVLPLTGLALEKGVAWIKSGKKLVNHFFLLLPEATYLVKFLLHFVHLLFMYCNFCYLLQFVNVKEDLC